ncbi:unnamed protein product, partial [Effrenium voratum]
ENSTEKVSGFDVRNPGEKQETELSQLREALKEDVEEEVSLADCKFRASSSVGPDASGLRAAPKVGNKKGKGATGAGADGGANLTGEFASWARLSGAACASKARARTMREYNEAQSALAAEALLEISGRDYMSSVPGLDTVIGQHLHSYKAKESKECKETKEDEGIQAALLADEYFAEVLGSEQGILSMSRISNVRAVEMSLLSDAGKVISLMGRQQASLFIIKAVAKAVAQDSGQWKANLEAETKARVEEEKIAKREQERIAKAEALKLKREQTKRDKELASQARAQAKVAAAKAKAADDAQVEDGDRRKRRRKGGEADDVEGRRRRVPGLQQLTESDPAVLRNLAKLPAVHAAPVQTSVDAFALSALCGRPVIARLKKGAVKKLMSACPNRLTKEAVNEACRFLNK